jgi:hypothetical protein
LAPYIARYDGKLVAVIENQAAMEKRAVMVILKC